MAGLIIGVIFLIAGFAFGAYASKVYKNKTKGKVIGNIARTLGCLVCIAAILTSCISYVPTGYTGIVTTFGKVHAETLDAGINFHAPWDSVITMDNREQRGAFTLEAFSKDIQQVNVQGSINYNIDKTTAMNLYRDVGVGYATILISPRIQEDVKIIIAKYTAENLIENRQAAADAIFELIKNELAPKGINVISLAVENIDFTDAFESAVEAKQVATQEKQRAQTLQEQQTMEATQKAERDRIAAQAQADIAKIAAQADLEVVKIQAEAALYAGEKEAEMNKRIAEGLTEELIHYYEIKQWDGQLPTFVGGEGTLPILNFEVAE
jgi:Membrane protease subunits, stomatin/prohibitin homologs